MYIANGSRISTGGCLLRAPSNLLGRFSGVSTHRTLQVFSSQNVKIPISNHTYPLSLSLRVITYSCSSSCGSGSFRTILTRQRNQVPRSLNRLYRKGVGLTYCRSSPSHYHKTLCSRNNRSAQYMLCLRRISALRNA